jgi:hypothetical protein
MINNDCFAYKEGECTALIKRKCSGCAFYKSEADHEKGRAAAFARLACLDYSDQIYISAQYYGSTMPWRSGVRV